VRLAAGVTLCVRAEAVLGVLLIGGGLVQGSCWFAVVGRGLLLWVAVKGIVMELVDEVMLVVMKLVDEVMWMKRLLAVVLVWFHFVLWFRCFPVVRSLLVVAAVVAGWCDGLVSIFAVVEACVVPHHIRGVSRVPFFGCS